MERERRAGTGVTVMAPRRSTKTEQWVHRDSVLALPGKTKDQLIREVQRREVDAIKYALKNGKPNKAWSCVGGACKSPPKIREAALPFYSYQIMYSGKNYDRPYGIRRTLTALCRRCLKQLLEVWQREEGKKEGANGDPYE